MTATRAPTAKQGAPSRKSLPVGASPRVSLLPPELGERTRQLSIQRTLRLVLVFIIVLTLVGVGAAWYYLWSSAAGVAVEQQRTTALMLEQQQYADVQHTVKSVELGEAALQVGGSTEINWQDYLTRVQASLPAGVALNAFSVEASTATEYYPQSGIPLQGARIATLEFTATSPTLPEIPDWLNRLRDLPGFVDANPGNVAIGDGGAYTASIVMHIDAEAYSNRLAPKADDAVDATADENEEAAE